MTARMKPPKSAPAKALVFCLILIGLMLVSTHDLSLAHDHWISDQKLRDPKTNQWCCNKQDCRPVEKGGIRGAAGGFLVVETGEVIPYSRILWESQDELGRWWRCRYMGGEMANKTRCLIAPPAGT